MRIKGNKEKKFSELENKNYEDLGYKPSLRKVSINKCISQLVSNALVSMHSVKAKSVCVLY